MDSITSKGKMEEMKMEEEEENSAIVGEKKALLIGLKHPEINTDVKGLIMRMKKQLMDLRGFLEDNITLMIQDEDEDEPFCFQPTEFNIDTALCALIYHAHPDDILYVYLIAHGCKPGMIVTSDKLPFSDYYFGKLLGNRQCTITFVSDCQIELAGKPMCCSLSTKPWTPPSDEEIRKMLETAALDSQTEEGSDTMHPRDELIKKILKRDEKFLIGGCKCFDSHSGNLSHVDILKNEKNEDVNKVTAITHIPTQSDISRPIRAALFTAFECDPNLEEEERGDFINTPKLLFPRPEEVASSRTSSPSNMEHTLYGSFTNAILDVIEETRGRVTNLELAQKAMEKLKIQGIHHQKVGLDCSDDHHAYDSFVC